MTAKVDPNTGNIKEYRVGIKRVSVQKQQDEYTLYKRYFIIMSFSLYAFCNFTKDSP